MFVLQVPVAGVCIVFSFTPSFPAHMTWHSFSTLRGLPLVLPSPWCWWKSNSLYIFLRVLIIVVHNQNQVFIIQHRFLFGSTTFFLPVCLGCTCPYQVAHLFNYQRHEQWLHSAVSATRFYFVVSCSFLYKFLLRR